MSDQVSNVPPICSGSSNLFVYQIGKECQNLPMQKFTIRRRIFVEELKINSLQRLLVENTNMSNVRERDILSYLGAISLNRGDQWNLCVLLIQSMTSMVVMKAYIHDNEKVRVFGVPTVYSIHNPNVKVIYLNIYNASQSFHNTSGYLKCIKKGPDVVQNVHKLPSVKRFLMHYHDPLIIPSSTPSVSVEVDVDVQSLLFTLRKTTKKMKVMNNKGATLVLIEGGMSCLSNFEHLSHGSQSRKDIESKDWI